MAWIDPRYLEHQAKRFIRPDWERYMRPDWRDRKYWVGEPPDNPFGLPNARRPIGKAAPLLDHWAEQEAIERERLALQRRLNALRLELATFKHDLLLRRKAYNPQQPR